MPQAEILTVPLPPEGLTAQQYRQLERALADWQEQVRANIKRYPRRSFDLGVEQTTAFLRLLGLIGQADLPPSGVVGPTKRYAVEWLDRYALTEVDGALARYLDDIKSNLLHGLRGGVNPTQLASWLYKATRDAEVNWRTIARTEMVRANAQGRYAAMLAMGYDQCWFPRHAGACPKCRSLLEGRVFPIEEIRDATNFGRDSHDWVACCPLHPHCRHVPLPYLEDVYEEAQREYDALEANGLDDKTLNEMFDSGGHLKPQYENDRRILNFFEDAGKAIDPLAFALGQAVEKTRREEPPGLHHTSDATRNCHHCEWRPGADGLCKRFNWPVDRDEVCRVWEKRDEDVGKGYFDDPARELDPLIWTRGQRLRAPARDRIVNWWRHTFTDDAPLWSHLYITGSAAQYNWAGRKTPGDVDVQIVVDYDALRRYHPEYARLPEPDLHAALVTQVRASLDGVEAAPGLPLDAFIRPETTREQFEEDARCAGQGAWDVNRGAWIKEPPVLPVGGAMADGRLLAGEGADLARAHPEWIREAERLRQAMQDTLDRGSLDAADLAQLDEAYTFVHQLRAQAFSNGQGSYSLGEFLWQWLMTFGPLARVKHLLHPTDLGKVFPGYEFDVAKDQPATVGTEHWITVHPHGEGEKGIPVLIRENGDGSATVIGGAGGHLDFLRISQKGRIKEGAQPKDRPAAEQGEPLSESDAQRKEEQAEQARRVKERAQQELQDSQGRIEDMVRAVVEQNGVMVGGENVGWDGLSATQRKDLVRQAINDSLYQSSYAAGHDSRRAEAPAGPIVVTPPPKEPKAEGDGTADETAGERPEREETEGAQPKPSTKLRIAMPTEHADALQEELAGASVMRRRVRDANKIIGSEKKPSDATDLEWEPVDKPAEAQRRAALLAQQQVNRQLLGEVDAGRAKNGRGESLVDQAIRQGAFDAFDSLSYSVFGKTILPTQVQRLLGVNGTAQLLAHELQQRAKRGEVNLKELQDTIDGITDDRQAKLTDLDLNRAKFAAREAMAMGDELKASAEGQSLFTMTAARSRQAKKLREAAQALGMAVSGSEALHTLRAIMQQPTGRVQVNGYGSKSQILDLAAKAGVHVTDRDIVRNGAGNYSLRINADRMSELMDVSPDENQGLKDRLSQIRTGEDLDAEIDRAANPPGYARTLDRAQAQGSMFLRAAGSGVLGFAPGVGKTDTAIAAALEQMASKPGHRALIVAPKTALAGAWAKTIQKAAPGKSLQIIGQSGPDAGGEAGFDWETGSKGLSGKKRAAQGEAPADFNIISFDTLKRNPELVAKLGHTIVIADEAQYAKNPNSQRLEGLDKAAEGVQHRWALTGTALEKNMGEYHTLLNWAQPGKFGSRKQFQDRFDRINQYDHLTGEEKVAQFREATGTGAFFQSPNASNMPAFPELQWEDAPLSEGHTAAYQGAVNDFNEQWKTAADARARRKEGEDVAVPAIPSFGGREAQMAALMKPQARGYHGPNTRVNKIADQIAANKPVEFAGFNGHATHADGAHAGTYAPKSIVFGQQTQPLQPIKDELERRGTHKVFYTDGSVGDNDARLKAFMEHDGPAVLITSDTNKTARSLQFGDNGGSFQHGATQMIHADMPQNNADLQQRIARIWRRGAQADVSQHILYSGTPVERSGREALASELRTQQALGNPEDKVGGNETMRQKLKKVKKRFGGSDGR